MQSGVNHPAAGGGASRMPHQKGNHMKLILSYIRRHIGMFATALFFLSLETLADLMQPTFMSYIVDDGVKGRDIGRILMYGAIMLGIAALGALGQSCAISMPAVLPSR